MVNIIFAVDNDTLAMCGHRLQGVFGENVPEVGK